MLRWPYNIIDCRHCLTIIRLRLRSNFLLYGLVRRRQTVRARHMRVRHRPRSVDVTVAPEVRMIDGSTARACAVEVL